MNYLRWVGFMRSLLIVGVLGAVVAPLSSEAAPASSPPTITLQLDSGTVVTINTTLSSTCVTGYNYCYTIPTGQVVTGTNGRQYRLDPNGTPRVRIADKNGLDKMSPTGFKLVPVGSWPNTEVHTLTLTVKHTFNATTDGPTGATINTANAGLTTWALRSAGEFNANSGSDPVNNKVTLTGTGIFSGSTSVNILSTSGTKNRSPLTFTIAGPAATADINWGGLNNLDMGMEDPSYPQFNCSSASATGACRPTVTQKLVATISGPDTLKVLSGPLDVFGASCSLTFSAEELKQVKFLKFAVSVFKVLLPHIRKPDLREYIVDLISYLERIILTTQTPPSDPNCPGANVVTFHAAVEQAADGLVIISDNSSPGVPAPLHYYAVIDAPGLNWGSAREAAQGLSTGGNSCDLATITSAAEQAIVNGLLPDPSEFPAEPAQQYWIGGLQTSESSEPGGGWQWINGEGMFWNNGPVNDMFANWGNTIPPGLQPDNACSDSGCQNHLSLDHRYGWGWDDNDQFLNGVIRGYVTEGTAGLCVPPVID
ncbi:MAG: hypothetical protein A4E19_11605 [Nitrospira sp. SG-bin1]|nr:MAG: hypothetical protein A4E19_10050 [Nitrospira sp. SG-bin1]OQW38027.1 MAG: hypothetical protein A4E19_11605 [Nitrospira sp. SG-bin1]